MKGFLPTRVWRSLCQVVLRSRVVQQAYCLVSLVLLVLLINYKLHTSDSLNTGDEVLSSDKQFSYNRLSPLIFIGGFPRSGTTLMRAMLDAHPDVRCGQETRIIPRVLHLKEAFDEKTEKYRMLEAGINEEVMDRAVSTFILNIMVHHGEAAPRLCDKDPFILSKAQYISHLFPRSKILFMVRDGRASIFSAVMRNVTIGGYNFNDPRSCLEKWNNSVAKMYNECGQLGPRRCMMVHYEQLVLHPAHWMRELLDFLDLPWNEEVLHHEQQINKVGGVKLSRLEKSSDQVIKPVNVEALDRWVGFYTQDIVEDMATIAPMLEKLGYDPRANPPNYGIPDGTVLENTKMIQDQMDMWKEKAVRLHLVHGVPVQVSS